MGKKIWSSRSNTVCVCAAFWLQMDGEPGFAVAVQAFAVLLDGKYGGMEWLAKKENNVNFIEMVIFK